MAVTDPNYANFDYAAALKQAASPLDTLGSGQLAIAQLANTRAYQQAQDKLKFEREQGSAIDLADRNHRYAIDTAALQAGLNEDAARHADERGRASRIEEMRQQHQMSQADAAAAVDRQRAEERRLLHERARQADPKFSPDSEKSDWANDNAAHGVIKDKIVGALKNVQQQRREANAELLQRISSAATIQPSDQQIVKEMAEDTSIWNQLNDKQRAAARQGLLSIADLESIPRFQSNQIKIADAAAAAKQKLLERMNPAAAQAVRSNMGELQSKFDSLNATEQSLMQSQDVKAHPEWLGEVLSDGAKGAGSEAAPGGLSPRVAGMLKKTVGVTADGSAPSVLVPPGTPASRDPNFYTKKAQLILAQAEAQKHDDRIAELNQRLDKGGRVLPPAPMSSGAGYSIANPPPADGTVLGDSLADKAKIAAELLALHAKKDRAIDSAARLHQELVTADPNYAKPATPPAPAYAPPVDPSANLSPTQQYAPPSYAPPAPSPTPSTNPPAMNGGGDFNPYAPAPQSTTGAPMTGQPGAPNPQQHQVALIHLLGTDKPQDLQRIHDYAQSKWGWTDQVKEQYVRNALSGDTRSLLTLRKLAHDALVTPSTAPGTFPAGAPVAPFNPAPITAPPPSYGPQSIRGQSITLDPMPAPSYAIPQ